MNWFGKPVPQNRFLGKVDQDDPTNLPVGLAAVCKNMDFTRDSGGPTCATTRAGINTAMQCLDKAKPVTGLLGFVYSPESETDPAFQLPLAFQPTQGSQYENPVGTGHMVKFPQTNFTEPQLAHAIQVIAGNKVFSAYSDLKVPISSLSTMDPKAKTLNPFGMKPVGFHWQAGLQVLEMEVCTPGSPSTGNGHTYQAQSRSAIITAYAIAQDFPLGNLVTFTAKNNFSVGQSVTFSALPAPLQNFNGKTYVLTAATPTSFAFLPGTADFGTMSGPITGTATLTGKGITAQVEPDWPLTEGGAVIDNPGQNQIVWTEKTMVIANRLPPPSPPALQSSGFSGTTDFYAVMTLVNAVGETLPSAPAILVAISSAHATRVNIPALSDLPGWIQSLSPAYIPTGANVYIKAVSTGSPAPPLSAYEQIVGSPFPLGGTTLTMYSPTGPAPPTVCTARVTPGQLPIPTTQPILDRDPSAGTFPAGQDVYVLMTYTNAVGETPAGPANSVINTTLDDAVQVTIQEPLGPNNEKLFAISMIGIYEADVPTGTPAPPASQFSLVGYYAPGSKHVITARATGSNPPLTNTTGPGGNIQADTATGGANGTQGYRFAAFMWMNQMETVSGFTEASVVKTIIDEDGWEIGAFNIPTGMPNVIGRIIPFSGADSSQAGPFDWIGLVNIFQPAQNFVYPAQLLVDQVEQSATVILDNVTTQGTFNFTDTYLAASNNVVDRLSVIIPPKGVRVDYLETVDRLAVTGVPGLDSGVLISLGEDYETFDANSTVPITSAGDRCFGVTDKYKGIPFAMMESGGFTLSPNTGNPNSWAAQRRWGGTDPGQALGPCGFRAWCACGKFIIFAHRSGIYKYDMSDPDLMSKEIPRLWATINWAAGETICLTIDEDTHTVRVLVPTGASMAPNQEFVLSYIEGWQNPIHFSTYSGKEISMDAARRWSNNDVSAFICARMRRTIPPGGNAFIDGPTFNTLPDSSFKLTQLLYASSGPDGTVQARTPGFFADNGSGIDDEYETMSAGLMQSVCKPEGFNLNACGSGMLLVSFLASRTSETDEGGEKKLIQELDELVCQPIALSPNQVAGITRKVPPATNEFWRVRFKGTGKGHWFSLKAMTTYVIPITGGRDAGDR